MQNPGSRSFRGAGCPSRRPAVRGAWTAQVYRLRRDVEFIVKKSLEVNGHKPCSICLPHLGYTTFKLGGGVRSDRTLNACLLTALATHHRVATWVSL